MINTTQTKHFLMGFILLSMVAGCSNDPLPVTPGNPNPPNDAQGIEITGTVTAPGGTIAQLEGRNTYFNLVFNYIITPTYADIIGLLPVANGTAELIEIDDDGNQVGDVLASAPLSITGEYSLSLPAGRSLAANLVVRISSGGASMRAMVVDQEVDINPISEYVLRKFIDDETLTLADIPVGQVIALQGRVKEFDLTAEADLSAMLDRLERDLGELVDNEIVEIKTTPDDGTIADTLGGSGTIWNTVEVGFALHDSESSDAGSFNMSVFSGSFTLTAVDTTPGAIVISDDSLLIDSWTNLNFFNSGEFNLHNELVLDALGEELEFTANVDANGTVVVETPFEEDLQTGECPEVGWRFPSSKEYIANTGNDNALIAVSLDAGVRYRTVSTTGDNCPNAIDLEQKDGDEVEALMLLVLKGGEGLGATDLNGNYGFVSLASELASASGGIGIFSTVGQAEFDGEGAATVAAAGLNELGFVRFPGQDQAFIQDEGPVTDGGFPVEYTVSSDGLMTLFTETILEGWVNDDASIFGLVDIDVDNTGEFVSNVFQEMMIGVALPSSAPVLAGTTYRLYPIAVGAGTSGFTEILTFGRNNTLSFGAGGTSAQFNGKIRGYERGSDHGQVSSLLEEDASTLSVDGPGIEGEIIMSLSDQESEIDLKGFVSADGTVMVLRIHEVGSSGDRLLGIILGVRQ